MNRTDRIYTSMPVDMMTGLNTRTRNALQSAGITTIGQIMDKTLRQILDMSSVGAGSAANLINQMENLDLNTRVLILEQEVARLTGLFPEGEG